MNFKNSIFSFITVGLSVGIIFQYFLHKKSLNKLLLKNKILNYENKLYLKQINELKNEIVKIFKSNTTFGCGSIKENVDKTEETEETEFEESEISDYSVIENYSIEQATKLSCENSSSYIE